MSAQVGDMVIALKGTRQGAISRVVDFDPSEWSCLTVEYPDGHRQNLHPDECERVCVLHKMGHAGTCTGCGISEDAAHARGDSISGHDCTDRCPPCGHNVIPTIGWQGTLPVWGCPVCPAVWARA